MMWKFTEEYERKTKLLVAKKRQKERRQPTKVLSESIYKLPFLTDFKGFFFYSH